MGKKLGVYICGGGSIGAEICDRVIAFGAARLLVVEFFFNFFYMPI